MGWRRERRGEGGEGEERLRKTEMYVRRETREEEERKKKREKKMGKQWDGEERGVGGWQTD